MKIGIMGSYRDIIDSIDRIDTTPSKRSFKLMKGVYKTSLKFKMYVLNTKRDKLT